MKISGIQLSNLTGVFMKNISILTFLILLIHISIVQSNDQNNWTQTDRLQSGRNWNDFVYPTVNIIDKDNGQTQGSQLVSRLFPHLGDSIKEIAKGVCQILYKEVSEVPYFEELQFELEYRDGVAYKAGNPPKIIVNLSTKYLESQYNQQGDDGIIYEINGVNWHELTHAYQYVPKNCGGYNSGTEFFGFIEGTADAVRILSGYHSNRTPYPGGSWTDGYTTTGFFIEWMVKNYDSDFLYKLNQTCKTIDPWSYDAACTEITGKGVQDLWDEYQWYLKGGGDEAVAQFDAHLTLLCKNQPITLINRSFNNPTSYNWTMVGASPSTSIEINPTISYSLAGDYDIKLVASSNKGSSTENKENYIKVVDEFGSIDYITDPSGDISCQYPSPFPGEGIEQLIDNNLNTKYCVKKSDLWFRYDCQNREELFAYSFTSAGDASWRDPDNWTLEGSDDGISWNNLDNQSGILFSKRLETKLFIIDSNKEYKYYKWNVKAKNDTLFQLAELKMYSIDRTTNTIKPISSLKNGNIPNKLINQSLSLVIPNNLTGRSIKILNSKGVQIKEMVLQGDIKRYNIKNNFSLCSGFYLADIQLENNITKELISKKEKFWIK